MAAALPLGCYRRARDIERFQPELLEELLEESPEETDDEPSEPIADLRLLEGIVCRITLPGPVMVMTANPSFPNRMFFAPLII